MNDLLFLQRPTPYEINEKIAQQIVRIRKRRHISQAKLSTESGVSLGSIKRFEQSGEISLLSLSKIALSLDIQDKLLSLFEDVGYMTLEEIEYERNHKAKRSLQ